MSNPFKHKSVKTSSQRTKDRIAINKMIDRVIRLINFYESYSEFARICKFSRTIPSMIVNGDIKNISFTTIHKIVIGTGVNANWLITGKGKPF